MKAISLQQTTAETSRQTRLPTFREALRFWLKLGFISFGGPTGQIAIMQTELVEKKKWIGQSRFFHTMRIAGHKLVRNQALAMVNAAYPRALTLTLADFIRRALQRE